MFAPLLTRGVKPDLETQAHCPLLSLVTGDTGSFCFSERCSVWTKRPSEEWARYHIYTVWFCLRCSLSVSHTRSSVKSRGLLSGTRETFPLTNNKSSIRLFLYQNTWRRHSHTQTTSGVCPSVCLAIYSWGGHVAWWRYGETGVTAIQPSHAYLSALNLLKVLLLHWWHTVHTTLIPEGHHDNTTANKNT